MQKIEVSGVWHKTYIGVDHLQAMDMAVEDIRHLHPSLNIRVTSTALIEEE